MSGDSEQLTGGHTGGPVVRVGETVRKRWTDSTESVQAFVAHLAAAGVDVPAPLGRDEQGRQVSEYVPGMLALDGREMSRSELQRVGALVRSIHDASVNFAPAPRATWQTAIPAPGAELVCHNDLAPWNLIIGPRWVFIDWDAAAWSTRAWDLAYAASAFTLNEPERQVADSAARLAALVDGYGPEDPVRAVLPELMGTRVAAMLELLAGGARERIEPWAGMYHAGHGQHWRRVTAYVTRNRRRWAEALGTGT